MRVYVLVVQHDVNDDRTTSWFINFMLLISTGGCGSERTAIVQMNTSAQYPKEECNEAKRLEVSRINMREDCDVCSMIIGYLLISRVVVPRDIC
jgi:hypothetical protein